MDDKGYLLRLIREGEHQQQDFKYRVADACKLAKSVSAFANTDGGRLLIGVRDDGHLSGVRSEEETPAEVKPPNKQQARQNDIQLCHFVCIPLVGIEVASCECGGRRVDVHRKADKREQTKQYV